MKELGEEELALFNLFEEISGVMPLEALNLEEAVFFIVPYKSIGKAIGKAGANVKRLEKRLGKKVFVFGNSKDIKQFVRNLFNNVRIYQIEVAEVMGEKAVIAVVEERDRKKVIGKKGIRVKGAKALLKKLFNASLHIKTKRVV